MGSSRKRTAKNCALDKCPKRSKLHPSDATSPPLTVTVRGRTFEPTPVFDTFWRFAAERHAITEKRLKGLPAPWTADPILQVFPFCNTYRVLDRVSQFIITEVIENGSQDPTELVFRILLFNTFTSINTYETLRGAITPLTWSTYERADYERVLRRLYDDRVALYTGAFQKPAPSLGFVENFMNHLAFMEVLMKDLPAQCAKAEYIADVFEWLCTFKSMGDFTAYQLVLNLSYSRVLDFSDYDFVVVGLGSRRGLQRCFKGLIPRACEVDIIRWMQLTQSDHFSRLKLKFNGLGSKARPIMLCDIEHTLCEIDKYVRKLETPARRPFHSSGALPKMRLPKAWALPARKSLRIKCQEEAEVEYIEKFVVASIQSHRGADGEREFLVYWEGYSSDDASWEPEHPLADDAPNAIKEYWKRIRA
ncbi:hypothetical protein DEU56DRAFT_786233 [Suillus clintonianus]|uniref:uncharacterized protein n=1 Tax=Suillus clintonianus TaxID=1904413 RepID=UPI001B8847BD|nr:uncharacterized protein DEU56DRAFT_786233 [Suillus clintonianus]KAG2146752.1 hypothetical protein DEU56DRAFT_786233 [Suillus clintonianus]